MQTDNDINDIAKDDDDDDYRLRYQQSYRLNRKKKTIVKIAHKHWNILMDW